MDHQINKGIEIINEQNSTCVVFTKDQQTKVLFDKGIKPLLKMLYEEKESLIGATVVDKIIGKAVASILICAKVKSVYSFDMTKLAYEMLIDKGIEAKCNKIIDYVVNRDNTGKCLMEITCENDLDPMDSVKKFNKIILNIE